MSKKRQKLNVFGKQEEGPMLANLKPETSFVLKEEGEDA
jgi:hypothetical protein